MRHPWAFDCRCGERARRARTACGTSSSRSTVAERTGLDLTGQFEITALMDDFVFGHAMRVRGIGRSDQTPKDRLDAVVAYMERQLATGEFPRLQAIAGDDLVGGFQRVAELATDPERFERGLQFVLDGIALMIEQRSLTS